MNATCSAWHGTGPALTLQGFGVMRSSKHKSGSVFTLAVTGARERFKAGELYEVEIRMSGSDQAPPTDLDLINHKHKDERFGIVIPRTF